MCNPITKLYWLLSLPIDILLLTFEIVWQWTVMDHRRHYLISMTGDRSYNFIEIVSATWRFIGRFVVAVGFQLVVCSLRSLPNKHFRKCVILNKTRFIYNLFVCFCYELELRTKNVTHLFRVPNLKQNEAF